MPVPSLLDTDLYKLTMQACVYKHFRDANVEYLLSNRSADMELNDEAVNYIRKEVSKWSELTLKPQELEFLKREIPYLPAEYYEYIQTFKLDPANEVDIIFNGGSDLVIKVHGAWHRTIWYEVPILATVSEAFFKFVDKDWNMDGQYELAKHKAQQLIKNECTFSEFGTRRRRSYESQHLVVKALAENFRDSPHFIGTSNVHLAHEFNLKPAGTVAHELMMGIAALTGDYKGANRRSMEAWIDTVGGEHAGVALTDTFGTKLFLEDFKDPYLTYYSGVRQDSGHAGEYTRIISEFYAKNNVPPNTKKIIYSDSLNVERCLQLRDVARKYNLVPAFGIGTFFTNDFQHASDPSSKSTPLNIVMKISSANGNPAVKLSDNVGKNTGDPKEVQRVKDLLGYVDETAGIDEQTRWG